MNHVGYLFVLIFFICSCSEDVKTADKLLLCASCHDQIHDKNHRLGCKTCHNGRTDSSNKDEAHQNLVATPTHPEDMQENCGPCHQEIVARIASSTHFTLKNSTNLFRKAFGAQEELADFRAVPIAAAPQSELELADDLLRRRCFRCHVYYQGDNYPLTQHGTGCAACHLQFKEGELTSHVFAKPADQQCLSCHYGNYVGSDYYGRFEHDFNNEFRTPYTTSEEYFRPYGVEYRQLRPDIHQSKGMACIDCHSGQELMFGENKVRCIDCHQLKEVQQQGANSIQQRQDGYVFIGKDGSEHSLPLLRHPAHFNASTPVACQTCHAQWSYDDKGKHFLRNDSDELDPWFNLSVQGSFELETIIDNNTDYDKDELPVQMSDKLTQEFRPGIWIKGYEQRRWENMNIGMDDQGVLTPMRPALDYHLSWINAEESTLFDAVTVKEGTKIYRPYVPHTTGSAGIFYQERIDQAIKHRDAPAAQ